MCLKVLFLALFLFLVYVNDSIQNLISTARLFADDTSSASTNSNIDDLQSIINHDLREILKWLVTFNHDKTEVLYFGNRQQFNNTVLSRTHDHKHLKELHWVTIANGIHILTIVFVCKLNCCPMYIWEITYVYMFYLWLALDSDA